MEDRYRVDFPNKLSSWKTIASKEIVKWYTDDEFQAEVLRTTMIGEDMGPFTKFLYYFGSKCECGWGVMIDFDERKQRVFLPDHYYKWMHKLRDAILVDLKKMESNQQCKQQ